MKARFLIAAAAFALAPITAYAGEPITPSVIPQKARALAERGREFHDAGDYGNAIASFKEAYVIAPTPGLLFNLAQAYRLQGNCDDAALMYRRYLDTGPSFEARAIAEGHLATVERCVHKRGLNIVADTSPAVVLPPPHTDGTLTGTAPRNDRSNLKKNVGIGLTIGGAVAIGVAAYYALDASSASSEVEDAYAMGAKWKDVRPIHERGEDSATMAKVFGIGGGLAVAGGVTMYVLGKRSERLAPIAIVPTKRGAEVSLAWRF